MTSPLARHYRRILWIYPRGERRAELLDTLLEIAAPSRRETLNLIRCGLRARLGRPASRSIVVFAVLVALAGGFLGAAAANRLAWTAAPPLPARDPVADVIFGGMTVWGGGDASLFVPPPDGEGIAAGHSDYWVKHTPATRDVDAFAAQTRQRLIAAGWTIRSGLQSDDTPDDVTSHQLGFWASKGNEILSFSDYYWRDRAYYDSDGAAIFELYRAAPPWLPAGTALGGLLGAVIGWLLTGWVSRRSEGRPAISALSATLTGTALVFLLPAVLFGAGAALPIDGPSITPFWSGLVYLGHGGAVWAGYFALAVLAMAAVPRRRPAVPRPWVAVAAVVLLVVAGTAAGWYRFAPPAAAALRSCTPTVPPALPAGTDVRLSRVARVFVSQQSTADERNLLQAAIFRVAGATSFNFYSEPMDANFRQAYCGSAHLPLATARTLPWFFEVGLSSPGVFPALEAEVRHLPPVVGVQHVSADE